MPNPANRPRNYPYAPHEQITIEEEPSSQSKPRPTSSRKLLTDEQYQTLLIFQRGVCAICRQVCASGKDLAVDHCHRTGRVRGLLCSRCNLGIGNFRDNPEIMENAIAYVNDDVDWQLL